MNRSYIFASLLPAVVLLIVAGGAAYAAHFVIRVNYHFNLFPAFEAAAKARDLQRLIGVLLEAKFTLAQATETATVLLADPRKYGY